MRSLYPPVVLSVLLAARIVAAQGGEPAAPAPEPPGEEVVYDAEDVVVTGTRTRRLLKDTPIRTELIRADEIEAKGAVNLLDAVEFQPGIRVDNVCSVCNTTGVKLSGLPARYTLMLIDGMPLYSSLGTTYGLLSLPAAEIERIEIVKGANSILYGTDAIGGVINVITRRPGEEPHGQVAFESGRFGHARAYGSGSLRRGDLGLSLTGSFSTIDSVDRDGDQISEHAGSDQGSFAGSGHWRLGEGTDLTFRLASVLEKRQGGGLGSFLEVVSDQRRGFSESILTRRYEGGLHLEHRFSDRLASSSVLSATSHYQDSDYEGEVYEADQRMVYLAEALTAGLTGGYDLVAGASYRLELLDENLAVADYEYHMPGVFVQGDWRATDAIELVHGLRYDWHNTFGHLLTPRVALKLEPHDLLTLRATVGTGFRAPTTFYEYAHGVAPEGYRLSNEADEAETSLGGNVSASLDLGRTLLATVEGAFNRVRHAITVETTDDGHVRVFNVDGNLDVSSFEAQLQSRPLPWLLGRVGYGFYHYADDGGALVSAPPSHQVTFGLDLSFGFGLKLNLAGDVYAPMDLESVYGPGYGIALPDPGLADWLDSANADRDSPKRKRSPWYAVLNVRAEQRVVEGVSLYAGVDNLLDYHQADVESPLFYPAADDGTPEDADVVYIWGPLRGLFAYGGVKVEL